MKKVHYKNIGFPRTGTTWLAAQLTRNPFIDGQVSLDLKEFRPKTFEEYSSLYKKYKISFNLDPHVFDFCSDINHYIRPEKIHTYTTHVTMSLRNPYDLLNSMYNFTLNNKLDPNISKKGYLELDGHYFNTYVNIKRIFDYWSNCKLNIKYLFYDDLQKDPKQYVYDVCSYIGVHSYFSKTLRFQLKTEINDPLIFDDQKVIDYINDSISIIEDKVNRDLSHWKK